MHELRFPKRELRVARAKREYGVRQRAPIVRMRADAHQDGPVVAAFDVPGMKIVQDRLDVLVDGWAECCAGRDLVERCHVQYRPAAGPSIVPKLADEF